MSGTSSSVRGWVKYVCLFCGLLLVLGSLSGMAWTGNSAWKLWQKAHVPAAAANPKDPKAPKLPAVRIPIDAITPLAGWFMGEVIGLFIGIRLLQVPGKKRDEAADAALVQTSEPVPVSTVPAKVARRSASKRWQSCNVLQVGPDTRRIWSFGTGKNGFAVNQEQLVPVAAPLPVNLVGRDWKVLFQPKLNIAWLPVEQVFLRVAQLPVSEFDETLAMVELQLEKLSPLPVTQIVWSVQVLPQKLDNLQTVIVIIMARDLVEKFLGELEGQGYLADRLELPILDQMQATVVKADGVHLC